MGPFFGKNEFRKELPYIQTRAGQTWFLLTEGNKAAGFISGLERSNFWYLDNIYVISSHRKQCLMSRLILMFMRYYFQQNSSKVVRLETQVLQVRDYFLKHQFSIYKQTKTWFFLEGSLFQEEKI